MLIESLSNIPDNSTKSMADADEISAVGRVKDLKFWWDNLISLGPKFGYFSQRSKSWLTVKSFIKMHIQHKDCILKIVSSEDGKRHLGASISSKSFNLLSANPTKWSNTLKQFVGNFPTTCLIVFDHFWGLALKRLSRNMWRKIQGMD